jgi:7-cyano-7-deazaguanine synthase in queuosine biosynthesis
LGPGRRNAARALRLDVGAAPGAKGRINLHVSQITRAMVAELPDRIADLLEIACYVYSADQLTRREGPTMPHMGADWRRNFRFRIAVRDLEFWKSREIRTLLSETLSFLSEDRFEFAFERTRRPPSEQGFLELEGDGPRAGFRPERVILFSGGLDSMAGAAESLLRDKVPVVLVSHHSSNLARGVQRTLAEALRTRAGSDRLLHVTVRINKGSGSAVEESQRTRAFLFASLGFAVGTMMGQHRVSFYENGIVSLNLPLAGHVLGTRATRTTHPRSLVEFGRLFSAVAGTEMRVDNPFFWDTKAGVVRRLAEAGCTSLIAKTFSCANVRRATSLGGQHCGVCSQCLDRRFGVLAAGCGQYEPTEVYAVDLFRGARTTQTDITMAEAYILTAHRHAGMSQAAFLGSRGELFRVLPHLEMPPPGCSATAVRAAPAAWQGGPGRGQRTACGPRLPH